MGQTIGKACIHPGARPFVNLPKSTIDTLRQSVNEVAEGFGLSRDELNQIVHLSLQEYIRIFDSTTLDKCSEALFALFQANATEATKDQDETLIDSFEFLATISIVSGMQLDEKIYFLFDLFDVSESGFLNFNEATLAFRLLASGSSKIASKSNEFVVRAIERLVLKGFEFSSKEISKYSKNATVVEEYRMNKHDFFHFVFNCSETMSFLTCFDDIVVEERPRPSSIAVEEKKPTSLHFDVPDVEETTLSQPWRDTLRLLPTSTDEETTSSPPTDGLTLDWIYGRNPGAPARYCTNGDIIYAAGSVVVKVSTDACGTTIQEYFMGHAGHVTSIDVIPVDGGLGDLVASADVGSQSKICVWSSITLQPIVAIPCLSKSEFSKIVFSPTGKLLMAIGNADRTITVYKWRERTIVYSSELPGSAVYDCSFLSGDKSFGVCTDIGVYFWIRLEQNMPFSRHSGVFNRLSTREVMTSIAIVEETVVTVSFSGRGWAWEGRVCTKLMTLCSGPVTRLFVPRTRNTNIGLCLSTQGGSVQLLGRNFEQLHTFLPNKGFDDFERIIDIICVHPVLGRVLVGQNHSLYQMGMSNKEDSSTISSGHPKIHGISMRHHNVITVGNDRIKIWDAEQHAVVRKARIGEQLSCVSYNQQEDQIAIGFRANISRSSSDKSFIILSGDDLQSIHHGCNSRQTLTSCMYSKDGKLLAFGSADASIYIHQTTAKFPLLAQLRGHTSPIRNVDFGCDIGSLSASNLRSNTACGEAMFWTTHGKIQTPLSQKVTVWESHTCIYTACLEGVHKSYDDGSSRVSSCCISSTPKGHSILIGGNDGNIRAFSHPSSAKLPLYLEYNGHSGAVLNIHSTAEIVYTVCHKDECMFQWKQTPVSWDQGLPIVQMKNEGPFSDKPPTPEMNMDSIISQMNSFDFSTTGTFTSPDIAHKQRSWKRSIVAPSCIPYCDGELPASNLILERIHGYSGFNSRNNLHYLRAGNVVYNIGKVLVRHDVENDKQYFCMSNGAISYLSIHKERSVCAIGHDGESPAITFVDLKVMRPLSLLNEHCRGIVCMDFDDSGDYLVSVGKSKEIVVYDWKNITAIATSRTFGLETLDVKFLKGSSTRIIECGTCFVRVWSIKGCSLTFQEIMMDSSINHIQYYSCIGWNGDHALVGTSTGRIIQFDGTESGRKIQAHQSAVINISTVKDGFLSSSSDSVKVWDTSMRCTLSLNAQQLGIAHSIVASCWAEDSVFVGTSGNEIWHLASSKGSNLNGTGKVLVRSHASSPLGISVSSSNSFATSGDDGVLRIWNLFGHQQVFDLNGVPSRSCAFSPHQLGTLIAIGFGKPVKDNARTVNGKWIVLSIADDGTKKILAERRDVKKYITTMKWHSNGDRLAVGSGDHKICVYSILTDTEPATALDITLLSMIDLTSTPIHFDFSRDGKYLKVNTESYDLQFFEAGPGIHIKEPSKLVRLSFGKEARSFKIFR
ncbi:hypothetical protein ACHAXH_001952, partial [Discostella pseudostelligera]